MSDDPSGTGEADESDASALQFGPDTYLVASVPVVDTEAMAPLTDAEQSVARAIVEGLSDTQIAERRNVSLHTVRNQISGMFDKLDVNSRFELVARLSGNSSD